MAEPMNGPNTRCPWCSAPLPEGDLDACPSCHATLTAAPGAQGDIKGVTTLDTEAILRARSEVARPRSSNRLLSFITGEVPVDTSAPADPEVFAPPPDEVRREMLRLQLEAEQADRAAETVALKADELARLGIPLSELGGEAHEEPAPDAPAPDEPAAGSPAPDAPTAGEPVHDESPDDEPERGWPEELRPDEPEPPAQA